jgi:hypothetical protein
MDLSTQLIPANIDAEKATLGALIMDRDAILAVRDWLEPSHFYLEKHGWVYEAILVTALEGTPPDIATVYNTLVREGRAEAVGSMPFLAELTNACPTAVHIEYYAREVVQAALDRWTVLVGGKASALGYDRKIPPAEKIATLRALVDRLAAKAAPEYVPGPPMPERASALEARNPAPPRLIIPDLFQAGLAFFIGQAGVGKTPALQQLALAFACGGCWLDSIRVPKIPVLYIGVEYSEGQILAGLLDSTGQPGLPDDLYVFGLEHFTPPATETEAIAQLEYWRTTLGVGVVIIDLFTGFLPQEKFKQNAYRGDYKEFLTYHRWALGNDLLIVGAWHGTKRDTNPATMYNGGQGMWGGAGGGRVVMYEADGDKRLYSQLRGSGAKDWLLQEVWRGGAHIFAVVDSDPDPVFAAETQRLIYQVVKQHGSAREPISPAGIRGVLKAEHPDVVLGESYVRQFLMRQAQRGLIASTSGGYYVPRRGTAGTPGTGGTPGTAGTDSVEDTESVPTVPIVKTNWNGQLPHSDAPNPGSVPTVPPVPLLSTPRGPFQMPQGDVSDADAQDLVRRLRELQAKGDSDKEAA